MQVGYHRRPDGVDVDLRSGRGAGRQPDMRVHGPRPGRHARAGRGLRWLTSTPRRPTTVDTSCEPGCPSSRPHERGTRDDRRAGRRPGADPRRPPGDARGRRGRRGGRGRRRRAAVQACRSTDPTWCSWTSGCRCSTASPPPRRSRRADLPTRVLVLTTYDVDDLVYRALRAGADGFLLKSTPADRLVDGVRLVAAGEALLSPSLTRRLIEQHVDRPAPEGADRALAAADGPRARRVATWSPAATRTPRSPPSCTSPRPPSRRTSTGCSPSCACRTASRPSCSPTSAGSSFRAGAVSSWGLRGSLRHPRRPRRRRTARSGSAPSR